MATKKNGQGVDKNYYKTIIICTVFQFFILINIASINAEIIFQDNFDNHADWNSPIQNYNNSSDISNNTGSDRTPCSVCPQDGAVYSGIFNARSSWPDYRGNPTMIIDSTNKRGDSGKGITFWMEPINSSSCDGGTYWCSDGQLAAKLPGSYDELYIRFYIKFQPGWKWADNYSGQMKFFRVGHYWGEGSQFSFGTQGNVAPLVFLDFHDTTGDGYPVFNTIVMPRFQATYRSGTGGCITSPSPSYLVNGDFERLAAPGGTGLNGNKKFGEWFGDNQWHKIEFHVKGNSGIGVADGIYNLTIDDTIILNRTNVAWADAGSCNTGHGIQPPQPFAGWNWFSIGGNMYNRAYSPTEKIEQWYAIDDLVISTTPIGEDDTGTVPGHPSRVWIE